MGDMQAYLPIAGTWARASYDGDTRWFTAQSHFGAAMTGYGYQRVDQDGDPDRPDQGYWSGDLYGLYAQSLWEFLVGTDGRNTWEKGRQPLAHTLHRLPLAGADTLTIIAHSHGGQVAACCLAESPICVPYTLRLVTIDMPVRRDMDDVYRYVRVPWLHCYSSYWNAMRWLGSQGGPVACKWAGQNIHIPGGHSGVLTNPQWVYTIPQLLEESYAHEKNGNS